MRQFSTFFAQLGPAHVTTFVERQPQTNCRPTVKQRLAALRMLFAWMVIGEVNPVNPAHAVRDPRHTLKKGKTHPHFTHTGGDWVFLPPPNITKEALHHGY